MTTMSIVTINETRDSCGYEALLKLCNKFMCIHII